MAVAVVDRIRRGNSFNGNFAIVWEEDIKVSHITVATLLDRDAIPEWKRMAKMTCYVIEDDTEYRLGADVTIAGQVWTERTYGVPDDVLVHDDILDVEGFIKPELIKNIFLNDSFVVDSEAAMLALSTGTGNFVIRTDEGAVFVKLNNDNPAAIDDFAEITYPGAVLSVNGLTGAVNILIENLIAANLGGFNTAVGETTNFVDLNTTVIGHTTSINNINTALTSKADLVGGLVPLAQLPYSFGNGLNGTTGIGWGGTLASHTTIEGDELYGITFSDLSYFDTFAPAFSFNYDDGINTYQLSANSTAGFKYDQDLSATFTAHSLITKQYTDQRILGTALSAPGADRLVFWDHSALSIAYLTVGTGLSLVGTTLTAPGGGGSADAYKFISDGTNTATAVGADTLKLRTGNAAFTIVVTNDDPIHGDNVLFDIDIAAGIGVGSVTYAKIQNVAAYSVFGRSTGTAGVGADITAGDGQVLRRKGTSLGFGNDGLNQLLFSNNQGIDVELSGGTDVLNIGTSNADTINIGWAGATVNIVGTLLYENVTNLEVKDKLIRLNKGGAVSSATSTGFEIEEDNIITGYFATSSGRNAFDIKTPAIDYTSTLSLATLTANRLHTLPDASGTIALLSDVTGAAWPLTGTGVLTGDVTINGGQTHTVNLGASSFQELFVLNVRALQTINFHAPSGFNVTTGPSTFTTSNTNFTWAGSSLGNVSIIGVGSNATFGNTAAATLSLLTTGHRFTDHRATPGGLEYAANYAGQFSARSIPDVAYIASGVRTYTGVQTFGAGILSVTGAPTIANGVRWTFNPDNTTPGLNVGTNATDPSTLVNGDMWYTTTGVDKFKGRLDGVTINFATLVPSHVQSSGNATFNHLTLDPVYNTTAAYVGTGRGIFYNPTLTNTTGLNHYAWEHTAGFVAWNSILTPAQLTGDVNDYNPTGWNNGGAPAGASILRLTADAQRNITSLTGGVSGRLAILANVDTTDNILLKADDSVTGTASNRFVAGRDLCLIPGSATLAFYDTTSARWRLIGSNTSSLTASLGTQSVIINEGGIDIDFADFNFSEGTFTVLQSTVNFGDGGAVNEFKVVASAQIDLLSQTDRVNIAAGTYLNITATPYISVDNSPGVPAGSPTDGIFMYAADISASSVLHVKNEAGDIIKLQSAPGWTAATGTATRTTFDTTTVTTTQLAERVKGLIDDLLTVHGLLKA